MSALQKIIVFALFFPLSILFAQERVSKVLVISGGGSRGAWGGGLAQALVQDSLNNYEAVVGSSTGSLLAPLIALEEFDQLRTAYTTIDDKDIFKVRPFKTKGPKRGQVRTFNAFWRILLGKRTLGNSKKLRKTIKKYYPEDLYNRFKDNNRAHISTVVNLTKDDTEYKSSEDYSYEETIDWMWASANAPVFMSLYDAEDESGNPSTYIDGGVKEGVPLQKGIAISCEKAIDNVDVIVHNTFNPREEEVNTNGVIKLLSRVIELFLSENRQNDLTAAKRDEGVIQAFQQICEEDVPFVTITFYFMPEEAYNIIPNELLFDEQEMGDTWDAGRAFFTDKSNIEDNMIRVYIPKVQVAEVFQVPTYTSN